MKATVSYRLQNLKFKISEGSDQNWSCPESAQLAVSVDTKLGETPNVHAWANDETFLWVCIQKACQRPRSYSSFMNGLVDENWLGSSESETTFLLKRLNFYMSNSDVTFQNPSWRNCCSPCFHGKPNTISEFTLHITKQIILTKKNPKWSQYHFNMILSVISDLRFFVRTESPQKSVLTMKINNQEGFHLTASKYVCTQTKFQLFYKSNNKWHHT